MCKLIKLLWFLNCHVLLIPKTTRLWHMWLNLNFKVHSWQLSLGIDSNPKWVICSLFPFMNLSIYFLLFIFFSILFFTSIFVFTKFFTSVTFAHETHNICSWVPIKNILYLGGSNISSEIYNENMSMLGYVELKNGGNL